MNCRPPPRQRSTGAGRWSSPSSWEASGSEEPCSVREARFLGTCANPHGIQFRTDIKTGITSDYAEPRELSLLSAAAEVAKIPAIKGKAAAVEIFSVMAGQLHGQT